MESGSWFLCTIEKVWWKCFIVMPDAHINGLGFLKRFCLTKKKISIVKYLNIGHTSKENLLIQQVNL